MSNNNNDDDDLMIDYDDDLNRHEEGNGSDEKQEDTSNNNNVVVEQNTDETNNNTIVFGSTNSTSVIGDDVITSQTSNGTKVIKSKSFYENLMKTIPIPRSSELLVDTTTSNNKDSKSRVYWDRSHYDSPESQLRALHNSCTLYIGNLNFTTRLVNVKQHFQIIGPIRNIIMGIDRFKKTPCGFCFIQYYNRYDTLNAILYLSSTSLDHHIIRVELDAGFQDGRQYGRGHHGGQVRDYKKMKAKDASLYPSSSSLLYNSTPRAGDKRQRGGGNDNQRNTNRSNTTNDTEIRPSVDDALPTARPNNNKGLSDANDAIITDTTNDNNETVMNGNNDINNTVAAENNDNDDDDAMEDNNDRPTKRLKM